MRRRLAGGAVFVGPNRPGWGGRGVFVRGDDLEPELRALPHLLAPGQTVLDVGASSGVYTVVAARLVGPAGTVVSLEPNPAMVAVLQANVARNRLTNVAVHQMAADRAAGRTALFENLGRPNAFGLVPRAGCTRSTDVPTTTLDDLVDRAALAAVHLVKIDVEGAEDRVLAGAAGLLALHRPALVVEVTRGGLGAPPPGYRALVAPVRGPNRLLLPDGHRLEPVVEALGWRPAPRPG